MSWFNIIKNDNVKYQLKNIFPSARIKLIGNTWKLIFNSQENWERGMDFFRTRRENTGFEFGCTFSKDLWVISFENIELQGME